MTDSLRTAAEGAVERLLNLAIEVENAPSTLSGLDPLSAKGLRDYAEEIEYHYAPDIDEPLVIPMQRNRYNDGVKSPDITVTGLDYGRWAAWDHCHIGGLTENDHGRRTQGGPMEPGPWAYSVTHALVIDNFGGSAREAESDLIVPAHVPFRIEGMPGLYQFTENPHHDSGPKLEKLP